MQSLSIEVTAYTRSGLAVVGRIDASSGKRFSDTVNAMGEYITLRETSASSLRTGMSVRSASAEAKLRRNEVVFVTVVPSRLPRSSAAR